MILSGAAASGGMPVAQLALALLVVAIGGTDFAVIDFPLAVFPPLTFASLRFLLASFPLLLFAPRPRIAPAPLAAYGLLSRRPLILTGEQE